MQRQSCCVPHTVEAMRLSARRSCSMAAGAGVAKGPERTVVGGGVAPEEVHQNDAAVLHGEGPLQRVDLVDAVDAAPNTCAPQHRVARGAWAHGLLNGACTARDAKFASRVVFRWPRVWWDDACCLSIAVGATLAMGRGSCDAGRGHCCWPRAALGTVSGMFPWKLRWPRAACALVLASDRIGYPTRVH